MIIINSAAYINSDLVSEFGKLPPCMLPVQNKRLYEHQINLIKSNKELNDRIYLTLPKSFKAKISKFDIFKLKSLNINIIYIQDDLSLGQAIAYTLNYIGKYNEKILMLHGDTLFEQNLSYGVNSYSYENTINDNYHWDHTKNKEYFTGYFSINNQTKFLKVLTLKNYNFIYAIKTYMQQNSGVGVLLNGWKDFGHINTYYRSVSKMTTERSFNSLSVLGINGPNIICKRSKDKNKMEAEKNWFENMPSMLQIYTPKIFNIQNKQQDEKYGEYYMEYFYSSSLANLFVFDKNTMFVWKDIISSCIEFINEEYNLSKNMNIDVNKLVKQTDKMYYQKTLERLKNTNIDLNTRWKINNIETPSINEILIELDKNIKKNCIEFCSIIHGDLCFSNILYDFKSKSIKVIDPRGKDSEGNLSIFGDIRYDVAKLSHSIIGMYDYIIANRYYYKENSTNDIVLTFEYNKEINKLQNWFKNQLFAKFSFKELDIYIIMIHLFLSMIPLHSDRPDRQKAFLANALRLYISYKQNNV